MNLSILKKINLSDKDIKIYLALLEHGPNSVRGLVEITGLNRGTTYDILKNLMERGLASYFHQETKQKFVAEDADKLQQVIIAEEEKLKKVKNEIQELIPELKMLQEKSGQAPAAKLYEGDRGIKIILDDVLELVAQTKEKEYYIYSAKKASEDIKKAYPDYTKKRIKAGIKVKAITLDKGGSLKGLDERKWLGVNNESATYIVIYAGKCAYISRDTQGQPVGVLIKNDMIYDTNKMIFTNFWKLIK